eukprot:m.93453 g.93453  ORF g.93453 m.93453 type:complete len:339 (-) comp12386_c2_seq1:1355-2371(-)
MRNSNNNNDLSLQEKEEVDTERDQWGTNSFHSNNSPSPTRSYWIKSRNEQKWSSPLHFTHPARPRRRMSSSVHHQYESETTDKQVQEGYVLRRANTLLGSLKNPQSLGYSPSPLQQKKGIDATVPIYGRSSVVSPPLLCASPTNSHNLCDRSFTSSQSIGRLETFKENVNRICVDYKDFLHSFTEKVKDTSLGTCHCLIPLLSNLNEVFDACDLLVSALTRTATLPPQEDLQRLIAHVSAIGKEMEILHRGIMNSEEYSDADHICGSHLEYLSVTSLHFAKEMLQEFFVVRKFVIRSETLFSVFTQAQTRLKRSQELFTTLLHHQFNLHNHSNNMSIL